ncbi:protein transport protein Yif1 [Hamiltosporidium tvaerminnensis]|uniref:Protein YIF1 n=1 Tax=Hamiltosporidium tvaerminnensis TaxID=1176355 RepID=A0A4V2JUX5_9MICR|nr:Protein transport protein yif1 [Hamiltosporidium tvaerminnensis]TBU01842.1 protein transport protein Yif1 [Hamiltosporidium tvaerminnensis]
MNVEMGKDVVKDYVNKGMQRVNFAKMRPYFNITNKYVLMKLIVIIFPFKNKEWHCAHHSDVIMADSMKVSDPDLYIPIMSFVTYILLIGLNMGFKNNFNPERLGIIFSRCLILELVCMSIVKLVGYFMDISELGLLDFLSFSGYKFVVIILNLLFKMKYLGVLVRIYFYCAFFFFLSRSLKGFVIGNSLVHRQRKIYFLFFTVILEVFLVFMLS